MARAGVRGKFSGGTPQNLCTFDTRKFSKFVLLIQAISGEKFPKFSKIATFALKTTTKWPFRALRRNYLGRGREPDPPIAPLISVPTQIHMGSQIYT